MIRLFCYTIFYQIWFKHYKPGSNESEKEVKDNNESACSIGFCSCEGSGDPHYYTPDGAVIHFMGTCKYTLWKSTIPSDQCEFKVETKNERRYGYTHVSYTRMIDFYMGNTQIRFLHGGNVLVRWLYIYNINVFSLT